MEHSFLITLIWKCSAYPQFNQKKKENATTATDALNKKSNNAFEVIAFTALYAEIPNMINTDS
jgi:hypothetical protein